ncbi:uncharacterized protein LOC108677823 isoform X2 [Hyalella azteca]|uniref:Uncharacterized protein LOC108677823 isoform X2 n=1 Tax=Hyalella azteca TaxID=294128 RepID=A0A8B7P6M1_HYAAZ|nr:uncharacterized protein LOC108677823 isoform X2 [Hyalella azteca]
MLDYMEGRDHHLRLNVLEDKKPRVPMYPPLDASDTMVMSGDSLFSPQSSAPSFEDRMIGDRNLLHHHREGRLARFGASHSLYTDNVTSEHTIADLRDTIMALQIQNNELTLCLQQERRRREEAENKVEREKGYIKRLEDTVQALRSTRLVIDPTMYRQIAESYIASRQTPVRRTCSSSTHRSGRYEDLVCDSSSDGSVPSSPSTSNSTAPLLGAYQSVGQNDLTPEGLGCSGLSSSASSRPLMNDMQDRLKSSPSIPQHSQDLRWPSDRDDPSHSSEEFLLRDPHASVRTPFDGKKL